MPSELSQLLDNAVAGLAPTPSYERGVAYLEAGRVGPLRASTGRVGATVQGSEAYTVELRAKGEKLGFSCSCPIGREGAFCKHCVAVALARLRGHDDPAPTLDDVRAYLESLPPSELVELLGGFPFFEGEPWFPASTAHALRALAGRGFAVPPAPREDPSLPTVRPVPTGSPASATSSRCASARCRRPSPPRPLRPVRRARPDLRGGAVSAAAAASRAATRPSPAR